MACLERGSVVTTHSTEHNSHGRVAHHVSEGVTVNPDEQARMIASIGDKRAGYPRQSRFADLGETLEAASVCGRGQPQRAQTIRAAAAQTGRPGIGCPLAHRAHDDISARLGRRPAYRHGGARCAGEALDRVDTFVSRSGKGSVQEHLSMKNEPRHAGWLRMYWRFEAERATIQAVKAAR